MCENKLPEIHCHGDAAQVKKSRKGGFGFAFLLCSIVLMPWYCPFAFGGGFVFSFRTYCLGSLEFRGPLTALHSHGHSSY